MSEEFTSHEHDDSRGIFVPLWVIDIVDSDHTAALVLAQVLWWGQPSQDGSPRAKYSRNEHLWLVRPDEWWWKEARLTVKQVRRVRSYLVGRGLVECQRFKANGAPTSAWRPLKEAISAAREAIRPNSELPSAGQFHGSDPQGAVPSAAQGAVPIPLESELLEKELDNKRAKVDTFNDFWDAYPRKVAKGSARVAYKRALKRAIAEDIVAGAMRYRDDPRRDPDPKFTAHPASWLNADRWEDEPPGAEQTNGRGGLQSVPRNQRGVVDYLRQEGLL